MLYLTFTKQLILRFAFSAHPLPEQASVFRHADCDFRFQRCVNHPADFCPRFHKNILQIFLFSHFHIYIAVNSAISHIIDNKSKGRKIEILSAVRLYCQKIFCSIIQHVTNIYRKPSITTMMLTNFLSIYKNFTFVSNTFKYKKNILSLPVFWCKNLPAISTHHLIQLFIKIVKRQFFTGMRQPHFFHSAFIKVRKTHPIFIHVRKLPAII